jgi:hypothetical protein
MQSIFPVSGTVMGVKLFVNTICTPVKNAKIKKYILKKLRACVIITMYKNISAHLLRNGECL